jgi:F0F1-type ATP synthase assembly protein I
MTEKTTIQCPGCNQTLIVNADSRGTAIECPKCHEIIPGSTRPKDDGEYWEKSELAALFTWLAGISLVVGIGFLFAALNDTGSWRYVTGSIVFAWMMGVLATLLSIRNALMTVAKSQVRKDRSQAKHDSQSPSPA